MANISPTKGFYLRTEKTLIEAIRFEFRKNKTLCSIEKSRKDEK